MKYGGGMNELPYPSDLTAAQWALIEPLLPAPKPKGVATQQKGAIGATMLRSAPRVVSGISWSMYWV